MVDFKTFFEKVKVIWKKKDAKGLPFFHKGKRVKGKWVFSDPDQAFALRLELVGGNRFDRKKKPKVKKASVASKIKKSIASKRTKGKRGGKAKRGQLLTRKKKERLLKNIAPKS